MATETDFLDLYRTLELSPGCGLLDLKRAYRRHVAVLHPDRLAGGPLDADDAAQLQRLTAQYGAAMDFQRRHGRLPGAVAAPRFTPPDTGHARRLNAREAAIQSEQSWPTNVGTPPRSRSRWMMPLAVVAVGVLLWSIAPLSSSPESNSTGQAGVDDDTGSESTAIPTLALGMSSQNVRAIEGNPAAIHDDRWDYGPSWVRFDQDRVIDWYSSPERALKVVDSRPDERR